MLSFSPILLDSAGIAPEVPLISCIDGEPSWLMTRGHWVNTRVDNKSTDYVLFVVSDGDGEGEVSQKASM